MNYCVQEEDLLPHNCLGQQTKLDQLVAKKTKRERGSWKSGAPFIVGLIVCCLFILYFWDHLEDFLNWLDALPRWQSGCIYVVLFTIISLPGSFGYLILNIAAGYMYGFWLGLLVIFIAVSTGSVVAFHVLRWFLPASYFETDNEDVLSNVRRIVEGKDGLTIIALSRLTPVPHGLQNGMFALTNISIFKYMLGTVVGLLPTQILNTYFGTTLRSMKDVVSNDGESYMLFSFQIIVMVIVMIMVARIARSKINKYQELSIDKEKGDLEGGEGFKKGHMRSKSASAVLMSKQKIINQPSQFR